MPPKRKSAVATRASKKRKDRASDTEVPSTTISVPPATPQESPNDAQAALAYDQLAAALLRQAKPKETAVSLTAAPASDSPVPGNSQIQKDQPSATTAGIGALLDQVVLGEPARATQLSVDIKEGIPLEASISSKVKSKIWNNEFIDLKSLLQTTEEPVSDHLNRCNKFKPGSETKVPYVHTPMDECLPDLFVHILGKIYP